MMSEAIYAEPAIPEPWVLDARGLRQDADGRWRFTIRCDEGSTILTGPRDPKIPGFECYFVGHSPTWTSYSYREVLS